MSVFDAVEVLGEFSKSIRVALIVLEGLRDLEGVDSVKVTELSDSVRCAHSQVAGYLVSVIGATSAPDLIGRQH